MFFFDNFNDRKQQQQKAYNMTTRWRRIFKKQGKPNQRKEKEIYIKNPSAISLSETKTIENSADLEWNGMICCGKFIKKQTYWVICRPIGSA